MSDQTRFGVITFSESMAPDVLIGFAAWLEDRGYESLWLPELFGREPVATAGYVLGRTERLRVATGIANVYVRDATAMAQTHRTLAELSGGRFMLGLGVSNVGLNTARGHEWQMPLPKMRSYLDAMAAAQLDGPQPDAPAPVHVAAHGPKLQTLGAERADGIITYLMPPDHTVAARQQVGRDCEVSVVCPFVGAEDPNTARGRARKALAYYMGLDYYHREWSKLGFTPADFENGGSDALIDTLVAWGDTDALNARVSAYAEAGASRVIVMPLDRDIRADEGALARLAPAG